MGRLNKPRKGSRPSATRRDQGSLFLWEKNFLFFRLPFSSRYSAGNKSGEYGKRRKSRPTTRQGISKKPPKVSFPPFSTLFYPSALFLPFALSVLPQISSFFLLPCAVFSLVSRVRSVFSRSDDHTDFGSPRTRLLASRRRKPRISCAFPRFLRCRHRAGRRQTSFFLPLPLSFLFQNARGGKIIIFLFSSSPFFLFRLLPPIQNDPGLLPPEMRFAKQQ